MTNLPPITQTLHGALRAEGQLQYESRSGKRRHWSPLHMRQSHLDNACGIHCLMVSLALVARTPRGALEKVAEVTRGPWRAFWQRAQETYFEGTSARDLEQCVNCLNGVTTARKRVDTIEQLHRACLGAITAGAVPLLGMEGPRISHWTVGVGVECRGSTPSAILALDPSVGEPWACFSNARLDLTQPQRVGKGKPHWRYRDTDGQIKLTRLPQLLIVSAASEVST